MAAIEHAYTEQTTLQSTTSTTYVDVTGASIASGSFAAGKKYLILVNAWFASSADPNEAALKMLHGSTDFADSEISRQPPGSSGNYMNYLWFTVWTAVSGEGVKMQFKSTGATANVDNIAIFAMNVSDNLTENTDWLYAEDNTTVDPGTAGADGASITFTPSGTSDWLVMTRARFDVDTITISYKSRIDRSGEASSSLPEMIQEPDAATEFELLTCARVFALTAASNTFKEVASTSGAGGASDNRTHSGIFALNLNKFQNHSNAYTEAEIDLSATDFATEVQTASITLDTTGDVVVLGSFGSNPGVGGIGTKARIQLDSVDEPATLNVLVEEANDARDNNPMQILFLQNMASGLRDIDMDGSTETAAAGTGAKERTLLAFSMELAGAPAAGSKHRLLRLGVA